MLVINLKGNINMKIVEELNFYTKHIEFYKNGWI